MCFFKSKEKDSSEPNARPAAAETKKPATGQQFRTSTPPNLLSTPSSVPAAAEGPVLTPDITAQPSTPGQIPPAQYPTPSRNATPPAQNPTPPRNATPPAQNPTPLGSAASPAQTPTVLAQTPTPHPGTPASSGNAVTHGYISPELASQSRN